MSSDITVYQDNNWRLNGGVYEQTLTCSGETALSAGIIGDADLLRILSMYVVWPNKGEFRLLLDEGADPADYKAQLVCIDLSG